MGSCRPARAARRSPRASRELLELVGLADQAEKYPAQLSGGQQQRVALARALALSPGLLLLDEPLSALDARVRARLRGEIRDLQQRLGITTIMVTHDQEEALTMSDRIVVMNKGRIEQVGTPDEIYRRPASPFVADFVGTDELHRGQADSPPIRRLPRRRARLRRTGSSYAPGTPVTICIRPGGRHRARRRQRHRQSASTSRSASWSSSATIFPRRCTCRRHEPEHLRRPLDERRARPRHHSRRGRSGRQSCRIACACSPPSPDAAQERDQP